MKLKVIIGIVVGVSLLSILLGYLLAPTRAKLEIKDESVGMGDAVKAGDTIVIHYVGTLKNGKKFDSSYDAGEPFETTIGTGEVIEGWDIGIPGMKVGGVRKLTIPPELAYGEVGSGGSVPPNSVLLFTVELLEIK